MSPGKVMIVAPLIGLVMIGLVVFIKQIGGGDTERFIADAQLYDAQVVGARTFRGRPGREQSVEKMYYIDVAFTPPGQHPAEREFEVTGAAYEKLSAASPTNPIPTQVYWKPAYPHRWHDIHEVESVRRSATILSWSFTLIGLAMIGLGLFAFTKWRRGATVMFESKPDEPLPPEAIAAMQRMGIPTLHMPGQEHELADSRAGRRGVFIGPQDVPEPPPPVNADDHVLYENEPAEPPAAGFDVPPWQEPRSSS
jgi:hypothetical protein